MLSLKEPCHEIQTVGTVTNLNETLKKTDKKVTRWHKITPQIKTEEARMDKREED